MIDEGGEATPSDADVATSRVTATDDALLGSVGIAACGVTAAGDVLLGVGVATCRVDAADDALLGGVGVAAGGIVVIELEIVEDGV